jgi:hypothetical protein
MNVVEREFAFFKVVIPLFVLCGCSFGIPSGSETQESLTRVNSPLFMAIHTNELVSDWQKLPKSGSVPVWYSSEMYNFENEGLAARVERDLSPVEKYDKAFRNDRAATEWERVNHGRNALGNLQPEYWWGHCHAVMASTILHKEPQHGFVVNDVAFSKQDVKALLAEINFINQGKMIGSRCEMEEPVLDDGGRMIDLSCRDLNPAAFHLVVANYVGRLGRTPVADIYPDRRVWSALVREFSTTEREVAPTEAEQLVASSALWQAKGATRFIKVHLDLTLVWKSDMDKDYDYLLELNGDGQVIGGEWLGESRRDHPDFLWYPLEGRSANPHVQREEVLYLLSLSRD